MLRCLSTALVFASAIILLPPNAHAGVKSGASFHPPVAPNVQPIRRHAVLAGTRSQLAAGTQAKTLQRVHKFSHHHHHHKRLFDLGGVAFYGPYYAPVDEPGTVDPTLFSDNGPLPGSLREGVFYRTGCRSEEVSVPSSHGPTRVTVTRCSIPTLESPPLK